MNKKLLIPTLILGVAVLTGTVSYANLANAQGDTDISQELADKLNVSQDQVSNAFDAIKEERQADRLAQIAANLDKAVSDGIVTAEQKQEILTKHEEFRNKQQTLIKERQDWVNNNRIDEEKLEDYDIGLGFGHHWPGRGHLKMMGGIGM